MTATALPSGLIRRLRDPRPIVLDGGMGGALEDRGVDVRNPLWSSVALLDASGRARNRALHLEYVAAGAEVLITNTHNASLAHCQAYLDEHASVASSPEDLLLRLHEAAFADVRHAVAPEGWIAGCLASPDIPYTSVATLTSVEVAAALTPQWRVMCGLRPDLVFFEMLTTESDVDGVANLLRGAEAPPSGVGLVCDAPGRLRGGLRIGEAIARLAGAGISLAFVQCTAFREVSRHIDDLVAAAGAAGIVPGVYANDGRHWDGQGWTGARADPMAYQAAARDWLERGARIVGGCCGTGPDHIRALTCLDGMC